MDADLTKRRLKAYVDSVYSEARLGALRTVFDGWGLALSEGEPTPETTVAIPHLDFELVADTLERGLPRCSFNSRFGHATTRSDGDVELSNYDWNKEALGNVALPRAQVQPLIELLRSLPGLPWIGFGAGRDEHHRAYDLEVVRRGMLDRHGHPWAEDRPLVELYMRLPDGDGRRAKHFLNTVDPEALLSRGGGEPLHVSTPEGEITIDGEALDRVIGDLRRALRPARGR